MTPYATTWDTTRFTDGLYDLRVITTDNVGNTFTSATIANVRVDNTAPTGSVTAPAKQCLRLAVRSVAVSANSADTGCAVWRRRSSRPRPVAPNTWTNLGAADTTSPYGVTWNTTSGFPDGRYDLQVVTTDKAGNTSTSAIVPVEVQNAAPTVTACSWSTAAAPPGGCRPATTSWSPTPRPSGWPPSARPGAATSTAQSLSAANDVTVTLTDGGAANDTVTVTSATCTFHLGTLNLGATGYVTGGSRTFSGVGPSRADGVERGLGPVDPDPDRHPGRVGGPRHRGHHRQQHRQHTPDAAIKNAVGTAITGTFATGRGSRSSDRRLGPASGPLLSLLVRPDRARRAVAQLVEHRSPKPAVGGSSPSCPAANDDLTTRSLELDLRTAPPCR